MDKVFMVGVGGVGMIRLAIALKEIGFEVYGNDLNFSSATKSLTPYGIEVVDSNFSLDKSFSCVIYSSAVPETDKFILDAKKLGLTLKTRGEMLADISLPYKEIVVSGTHGKTTTAAMTGTILGMEYRTNVYVGGKSEANKFMKDAEYFVIESDESDKTFLLLNPHLLILTNIDMDHLNAYDYDFSQLKDAFHSLLKKSYIKVVSMDDSNAYSVSANIDCKSYYYSLSNENADAFAENIMYDVNGVNFDLHINGKSIQNIHMNIFGPKNISNAVASALSADLMGVSKEKIIKGLANFVMPSRRLEKKGEINGIVLFDDHADHPTEVEATLTALKIHFPRKRIIAIFQPHRYTRMNLLKEEVAKPFYLADVIIVNDIFSAFENPVEGISGEIVASWIRKHNFSKDVYFVKEIKAIPNYISVIAQKGDIIVLLGPGNIGEVAAPILQKLKEKK